VDNKEYVLAVHKKQRRETPEKEKARARAWRKRNPSKRGEYHRRQLYGLTPEQYGEMIRSQNGKCGVCAVPFTKTPHVDHDHSTGAVRELLCTGCNRGLGLFKDSPERMRAAIEYLEKHRAFVDLIKTRSIALANLQQ